MPSTRLFPRKPSFPFLPTPLEVQAASYLAGIREDGQLLQQIHGSSGAAAALRLVEPVDQVDELGGEGSGARRIINSPKVMVKSSYKTFVRVSL